MKVDIEEKVRQIINDRFEIEDVEIVPDIDEPRLDFGNNGLRFEATVLYIWMKDTEIVLHRYNKAMLAKFRKAYFHLAVEIVHSLGGAVRKANDDAIYVFFQGTTQESLNRAVKAAMKIKYMLTHEYSKVRKVLEIYEGLNFAIGIDDGKVLCTKLGSGETPYGELVWSGNPLNMAREIAKRIKAPEHIGVSELVHFNLNDSIKYSKVKEGKQEIWHLNHLDYQNVSYKYYSTSYFWTVS